LLVKLDDKVKAGQNMAIQRNTFGEVVAEYTTEVAGEVTGAVPMPRQSRAFLS
jgi:predicted deacylase